MCGVPATRSYMRPGDEFTVIGDFNLPSIKWQRSSHGGFYPDPSHSILHSGCTEILDVYSAALLRQTNSVVNETDVCLTSVSCLIVPKPPK